MALVDHARDLSKTIMLDTVTGMGQAIRLVSPEGYDSYDSHGFLTGRWQDIGIGIDNETGLMVTSRTATLALSDEQIITFGYDALPQAVLKSNRVPWLVYVGYEFSAYAVVESAPDRSLGVIVLHLEDYKVVYAAPTD